MISCTHAYFQKVIFYPRGVPLQYVLVNAAIYVHVVLRTMSNVNSQQERICVKEALFSEQSTTLTMSQPPLKTYRILEIASFLRFFESLLNMKIFCWWSLFYSIQSVHTVSLSSLHPLWYSQVYCISETYQVLIFNIH